VSIERHRVVATRASRIIVSAGLVAGTASLFNRGVTLLVRGGTLAQAVANDLVIVATVIALSADHRYAFATGWFRAMGVLAELLPAHAVLLFTLARLGFGLGKALAGRRVTHAGRARPKLARRGTLSR
jgi:hypothetical protein